jgi:hypothetical protein
MQSKTSILWEGDIIQNDIRSGLKILQYHSVWGFLQDNIGIPYFEVVKKILGHSDEEYVFALLFILTNEDSSTNHIRDITKDALVRYLHEYSVDWTRKTKSINNRINAYNSLKMVFMVNDQTKVKIFREIIKNIWDYLEERVPPHLYWMPDTPEDTIILEVFDRFWPLNIEW